MGTSLAGVMITTGAGGAVEGDFDHTYTAKVEKITPTHHLNTVQPCLVSVIVAPATQPPSPFHPLQTRTVDFTLPLSLSDQLLHHSIYSMHLLLVLNQSLSKVR